MKPFVPAINPGQAMGLPAVYIEKIKLLPPNRERGVQDVQIDLSLQVVTGPGHMPKANALKILNGPYRIFVAFCREAASLVQLKMNPLLVKTIIKNPKINPGDQYEKHYMKPNLRGQRVSTVVVGTEAVVASKKMSVVGSFPLEGLTNLYFFATAYGADPQSGHPSGFEGKIRSMRVGAPVCEVILNNGAAPTTAAFFQLRGPTGATSQIWTGPVHYREEEGYMGGPKHDSRPHPRLIPLLVSNQKLQDLRFIEFVNQLDFTLSKAAPGALSLDGTTGLDRSEIRNAAAIKKILRTPRYVSDASYSRMQDNSLKVFFSIDYGRLVQENSTLGYMIQNPNALYASYSLENIKIYRTRINANVEPNELTPGKVDICGSGQRKPAEEDVLVATLGSGVDSFGFHNLNGNVLALAVTDSTMANYNFGTYEYRAVIEAADETASAVKMILNRLEAAFSRYELFYSQMSGYDQPGAGIQNAPLAAAASKASENTSWKDLIGSFLGAVEFIFGTSVMKPTPLAWRKNLVAMVNPASRDTSSMLRVKTIIGDFITNLRMISTPPTQPTSAAGSDVRSKIDSQNSSVRKLLLDHVFRANYTSHGPASEGTDYLDVDLVERNGALINISYENYSTRLQMELSKFVLPKPNDPGINQYGFLTPVRINTEGSVVDTSTVDLESSLGSSILNASLDPNSSARPPTSPNSSDTVYYNELNNILLSAGISAEQTTLPLGAVLQRRGKDININTLKSSQFISATSPFFKENTALKTTLSGSNEVKMNIGKDITENVLESGIVGHLVNMRAINFIPPSDYRPPDNARGSLAAESAAQNPDSLDSNSTFGQSVNFNSVAEIQYFAGYTRSDSLVNLNDPTWKTLTRQVFSSARSEDTPLLCRVFLMTPSLNMPNNYKLPLYNEFFLLGAPNRAISNLNVKGSTYQQYFKSLSREQAAAAGSLISKPSVMINLPYTRVPLETTTNASGGGNGGGSY